jgi:hypothetical protein
MSKVRKTPSLSSLPRNDQNTPSVGWSTVQCIRAIWRFTFQTPSGPPFSGCGRFGGSPSHLQHYINRRIGVELPQHSLPLHCYAVKKFNHSRSFFTALSSEHHHLELTLSKDRASSKLQKRNINFVKTTKNPSDGQSAFDCKGDS